ncbi:hypothetical protein BDZ89DRAFT_1118335 [Hymenopellis radicata]|nr:hypothetical protein BDZ89DRAFT_1118335 [Hymenopellis radicata]
MAAVEQLIADAVATQTRLRSSIATHTTLLSSSPLRALPGEVLSEIFLHYLALFPPATRDVFKAILACHRIRSPLLQVCRRWRTTALADPRLWTTIPLVGSAARDHRAAHPLILGNPEQRTVYWLALEDWIERSSALPLDILFHLAASYRIGDPEYAVPSFETFIRLFPRAKTLSLYLELHAPPALASVLANAEFSPAYRVRTASIDVRDDDKGLRRKILSAIPNVEVLEIGAVDIGQWFDDAPNLTRAQSLRLVEVLDLLDGAPLLETLKLFRVLEPTAGDNLRVVIHDFVSTFQLILASLYENDAIFQHLTFPVSAFSVLFWATIPEL